MTTCISLPPWYSLGVVKRSMRQILPPAHLGHVSVVFMVRSLAAEPMARRTARRTYDTVVRRDLWSALAAITVVGVMACGGKTVGEGSDGGPGSSGSSGGGSGDTFSCSSVDMAECITLPTGVGASCPMGTTSLGSCPSSNQLGCCSITATTSNGQSVTVTSCFYCAGAFEMTGSASTFSMACDMTGSNAKWTAGDVASCGDGG